jgi:hypothetical protein
MINSLADLAKITNTEQTKRIGCILGISPLYHLTFRGQVSDKFTIIPSFARFANGNVLLPSRAHFRFN